MTPIEYLRFFGPPAAFIVAGLIAGLLAERIVLSVLRRAIDRLTPGGGVILSRHLRGQIVIWCTLAGALMALESLSVIAPVLAELLQHVLRAGLVLSISIILARLAGDLVSFAARRSGDTLPAPQMFIRLTQGVILAIGLLVSLEAVGISVLPILAALGVGGLAVGLALQAPLTNLFAGIYIMLSRKVKPGDYIRLQSTGQEGYVVDTDFKHTMIRELPNNLIIVPNSAIMNTDVHNFSLPDKETAVLVNLGVSYGSDLERVERISLEVARETLREVEGGVPEFEPLIRFNAFEAYSIRFTCVLRAREFTDRFLLTHEFIKRLHRRYRAENIEIEIPLPIRTIDIRNPRAEYEDGGVLLPPQAARDGSGTDASTDRAPDRETAVSSGRPTPRAG